MSYQPMTTVIANQRCRELQRRSEQSRRTATVAHGIRVVHSTPVPTGRRTWAGWVRVVVRPAVRTS
jgi:hypothetical protein